MIWVSIYNIAHVVVHCNPWYLQNTIAIITSKSGAHVQRKLSQLSPTIHEEKWILSLANFLLKHCQSSSYKFGIVCFDNDNACNNNYFSRQNMMLHKVSAMKWFHSPCHKDLWLFPSLFWFTRRKINIFDCSLQQKFSHKWHL
jgi:hypothetical protein